MQVTLPVEIGYSMAWFAFDLTFLPSGFSVVTINWGAPASKNNDLLCLAEEVGW